MLFRSLNGETKPIGDDYFALGCEIARDAAARVAEKKTTVEQAQTVADMQDDFVLDTDTEARR